MVKSRTFVGNKFLIFADLHYDAYSQFDSKLPRLEICRSAFRYMVDFCVSSGIKTMIGLGDIFDRFSNTPISVVYELSEDIRYASDKGIHLILLSGNHDYIDKGKDQSIVQILERNGVDVYSSPSCELWNLPLGLSVVAGILPDCPDMKSGLESIHGISCGIDSKFKILLAHCGIFGAMLNEHKASTSPISVQDLSPEKYQYVLLGDYHRRQSLAQNVFYVGAVLQKNFGECGNPQGFSVLEFSESGVGCLFHDFPKGKFPEFRTFSFGEVIPTDFIGYARIISEIQHTETEITDFLEKLPQGVLKSSVEVPVEMASQVRVDFSKDSTLVEQGRHFIDEFAPDHLGKDMLKELLSEYVSPSSNS